MNMTSTDTLAGIVAKMAEWLMGDILNGTIKQEKPATAKQSKVASIIEAMTTHPRGRLFFDIIIQPILK